MRIDSLAPGEIFVFGALSVSDPIVSVRVAQHP